VDAIIILLACLVVLPFTAFTGLFFFPLMILVIGFFYRVATLSSGSSTWGMRLMGMELRTQNDERLDTGTALLHTLGYTVSISVMPLQLISIVLMGTTARCQGLSDMVLGTVALNRRKEI
ncbi:MAG: RDD family protein, partial [Sulfitobacter sp.]|nr:RDD family protein [Sulfitobacter sp.]